GQDDLLADCLLARPKPARRCLVDHDHARAVHHVLIRELTSRTDGDRHRPEIVRADDVEGRREVFAWRWWLTSGNLETERVLPAAEREVGDERRRSHARDGADAIEQRVEESDAIGHDCRGVHRWRAGPRGESL